MTVTEQLGTLDHILAHGDISSLFQPIVSLSERRIIGHEALTRGPSNTSLHSPINLLAAARHGGRLDELEMLCRENACRRYRHLQMQGQLFLNASPETLLDARHKPGRTLRLLQQYDIPAENVVIELTEQTPTDDLVLLDTALHHYRSMGFTIALDDLGAGYSSLRMWSELRPDYVKIDRYFIDGIHRDAVKRRFVESILKIARTSQAQVIAEGIELPEELSILTDMGVDLVQGYLLGRPKEEPCVDIAGVLPAILHDSSLGEENPDLSALLLKQTAVSITQPIAEVQELFRQQASLDSVAVLNADNTPIGVILRSQAFDIPPSPLAADQLPEQAISRLINEAFLSVDIGQSLPQLSRLLTSRTRQRLDETFVITRNGRYLGLGRAIDVLRLITEMKTPQAATTHIPCCHHGATAGLSAQSPNPLALAL